VKRFLWKRWSLSHGNSRPIYTTQLLAKAVACNLFTPWVVLCELSIRRAHFFYFFFKLIFNFRKLSHKVIFRKVLN
jgi:hypothetical protein